MRAPLLTALLVASSLTLTACGTIVHGGNQSVGFTSAPTGAQILVDGEPMGVTPTVLDLSRKRSHTVSIELDGYQPHTAVLTRELDGLVLGNIVFGGLIGLAVDASTGGMYRLKPEEITAEMAAQTGAVLRDADVYIAVVLHADPSWEPVGQLVRE